MLETFSFKFDFSWILLKILIIILNKFTWKVSVLDKETEISWYN